MKKLVLGVLTAAVFAGSSAVAVYAQQRPWFHHQRMSSEDRAAFADARIAAVKAGLKLNADQDKLWPPVETAVRDFAKLRIDRANARMNEPRRDDRDADRSPDADNPVARLRERADNMATTAAALKRISDAADPLYKSLDDGQKRRLMVLTHMERFGGGEGWRHHRFGRGPDDGDRGNDMGRGSRGDDGPGRGFGPQRERL